MAKNWDFQGYYSRDGGKKQEKTAGGKVVTELTEFPKFPRQRRKKSHKKQKKFWTGGVEDSMIGR